MLVLTCSVVAVTQGGEYPTDPCFDAAVEAGMSEEVADVLLANPANMLAAERAMIRQLAIDLGVADQCADRLDYNPGGS